MRRLFLYTALALAANAAAAGTVDWQAVRDAGLPKLIEIAPPAAVPDVLLIDPEGTERRLAQMQGKVVLLNFWATWCAPCREEMPSLQALQDAKGGDDFAVVTVAVGRNSPAAIDRFFAEAGITTLPKWMDSRMELARAMGAAGLPVSVLLDREGREVARLIGDADWSSPAALMLIDQATAEGADAAPAAPAVAPATPTPAP